MTPEINGRRGLVLGYVLQGSEGSQKVFQEIELEATSHFLNAGGSPVRRWWFRCPLEVEGHACRRRAQKLYLPPGETRYGCRACHRLTYVSTQAEDKRINYFRKNPEECIAALQAGPDGKWGWCAVKALPRRIDPFGGEPHPGGQRLVGAWDDYLRRRAASLRASEPSVGSP